jgi:hypothetical protein
MMSCGKVKGDHIASIQNSIHTAMKLWRGLYGTIYHSRPQNSMTQEAKASKHSSREHKRLLPSVRDILKEVYHNAKRYRVVLDQNGAQTKTLVLGKHDEHNPK